MKTRSEHKAKTSKRAPTEMRGVVKKMTGRLTNNGKLESEGHAEMTGGGTRSRHATQNPDPHRRG
jgi:uncharacterized protein YjbJ (UPF0337 family)